MTRLAVQNIEPTCIECGKLAELVGGDRVYPDRPEYHDRQMYLCGCGAYVGCHAGTDTPLGYPAGPVTRRARSAAHAAFDPLIARKMARDKIARGKARAAAYKWLAESLGIPGPACHIAHFDFATCARVVALCEPFHYR